MPIGDMRSGGVALASNSQYLISANAGEEWVVHNVYADAADFYIVQGGGQILLSTSGPAEKWWSNLQIHVDAVAHHLKMVGRQLGSVSFDAILAKV